MDGEQIALWLGIVVAVVVVAGTVGRGTLGVARMVRRRIVKHRNKVVREAVQPLFEDHGQAIEEQLTAVRLNQEELSHAIGVTTQRVSEVERSINGIPVDVSAIKKEQERVGKRIDKIYDHLID